MTLPAVAAQGVETAVVAHAGKGVRLHHLAIGPRLIGENSPGQRTGRVIAYHLLGIRTCGECGNGRTVGRKQGGRGAVEEILANAHVTTLSLRHVPGDLAPRKAKEPRRSPRLLRILRVTT